MDRAAWKQLALLLSVALLLRLAAGWYWQARLGDDRFGFPDSQSYWALGHDIAAGQPYVYSPPGSGNYQIFRTPGYPLLLAPILLIADGHAALMLSRAESALLGTLAVAGVWWLGRMWFDRPTGLVAAALAAVYPEMVVSGALVLSEAAFCPLMLLQLGLGTAAWRAKTLQGTLALSLATGAAAGAATLARPSWLLFTPLAIVVGLLWRPRSRATLAPAAAPRVLSGRLRVLFTGGLTLAAMSVVMLPWWLRNWTITWTFVPTTLQVGASLYDGLNPHATGASNMDFVREFIVAENKSSRRGVLGGQATADLVVISEEFCLGRDYELRLDRQMRDEAIAWARQNPGQVLKLAAIKFGRMWNVWPNEAALSNWPVRLIVLGTYLPVMLLAIGMTLVGLLAKRWERLAAAGCDVGLAMSCLACWLPAAYFTLLHLVFVSSIRYRLPAMYCLVIPAAAALIVLMRDRTATAADGMQDAK